METRRPLISVMPPNCQYSISTHGEVKKKNVVSDISDEVPVNLNNIMFDSIDYKRCNLSDRMETSCFHQLYEHH